MGWKEPEVRGRILLLAVAVFGAAVMAAACSRRDSLYMEPGKAQPPEKPAQPAKR